MSREIKFRALNPQTNEYHYADVCDTDEMSEWITWDLPEHSPINTGTRWDVEQFTGAFDVNSNEMHTGDKVCVDGLGTCTVALCPYYGVVFVDSTGDEHSMISCMAENNSFKLIEGSHSND